VRFAVARQEGLDEAHVAMIDDGYETSALSERQKVAIALTDAVIGRTDGVDAALASRLRAAFASAELVELGVTAALCQGFSKIAIALGAAPPDMPVTVVPTPAPPE
jgi:alkylhydroperoxidase family enzyme